MGVETAIGLGTLAVSAASTGLAVQQASQQNRAVKRSITSAQRAGAVQVGQLTESAGLEAVQAARARRVTAGRARLLSAVLGGSPEAALRQSAVESEFEQDVIGRNLESRISSVFSQTEASVISAESRRASTLAAAIEGALGGATTGLQIGRGLQDLYK